MASSKNWKMKTMFLCRQPGGRSKNHCSFFCFVLYNVDSLPLFRPFFLGLFGKNLESFLMRKVILSIIFIDRQVCLLCTLTTLPKMLFLSSRLATVWHILSASLIAPHPVGDATGRGRWQHWFWRKKNLLLSRCSIGTHTHTCTCV